VQLTSRKLNVSPPNKITRSRQLELSKKVKEGCKEEGLIGLTFNTIGISDAITMGTDGKCI
jgi:dihydroxyacid dehydratase/phosphogluconate dehydratase